MARTSLYVQKISGSQHVVVDVGLTTGTIVWVHSGTGTDSAGLGLSPDTPVATLDYAIGLCTSNKFDRIFVMPGHAENVSAAGGITADVPGISIIGMGQGSNRPTFSFANTAATIAVSAANVSFRNIRVTSTVDEVVKMFNVTAANCTLDTVDHFETSTFQTLQFCLTSTAAKDLTIQNCRHYQITAAASAQLWIQLIGADRAVICDNIFHLTLNNAATSATITSTGTAPLDITITRNAMVQLGGTTQVSVVLLMAATSGMVHDNRAASAFTAIAGTFALASCFGAENMALNTVNKSGILDPVVDS